MTMKELTGRLRQLGPLDDSEIFFDDLNGGRLPVADVRIESPIRFEKPGTRLLPAIVIVPRTGLEDLSAP